MKKIIKTTRVLKFIDARDGLLIYINPNQVAGLKEVKKQYIDPNNVTQFAGTSTNYYDMHPDTLCIIYLNSGMQFQVREHIAIVTAMLKGEDPSPAEVIFGTE